MGGVINFGGGFRNIGEGGGKDSPPLQVNGGAKMWGGGIN